MLDQYITDETSIVLAHETRASRGGPEGVGTGLLERPGGNDHKGIRPAGVWRNIGLPCFGEALRVIEVMSHEFGMSDGI